MDMFYGIIIGVFLGVNVPFVFWLFWVRTQQIRAIQK